MKSPSFQFYPSDWLGSQRVQMLTLEEEGAYIRLLASCWQHGSIPADPEMAAKIIGKGGSTTLATTVLTMFQPAKEQGRMTHDRLELEREKQAAWRAKSSAGGKKSAEMRSNLKGGSTTVPMVVDECLPNGTNQTSTLLSSVYCLPSSINTRIYDAYPRKTGKLAALKAINKALKTVDADALLDAVKSYAAITATWPEADRRFIPNPSTWFNQGRYEDDPSTWERGNATAASQDGPTNDPMARLKGETTEQWEKRLVAEAMR